MNLTPWVLSLSISSLFQSLSALRNKALDFSADNDCEPDENNSYTQATLQIGTLPCSFTICTVFMVEYWTEYTNARLYGLHDENEVWHFVEIFAAPTYTEFTIKFEGSSTYGVTSDFLFYPLQWTRICLSMDSNSSEVQFVVEGELVTHKPSWVKKRPDNLNLTLGMAVEYLEEYPGSTTNLNIFSTALPAKQMKTMTSTGEECGLAGDILSWEESLMEDQWTLHSEAKWVDLVDDRESPCMRRSRRLIVFSMDKGHYHSNCMDLCRNLGGRSPSLMTKVEWKNFVKELKYVNPDPSLVGLWLSATEGDISTDSGYKIGSPDHWPEGTKAEEGVWRDYYTGKELENYTKPWVSSNGDMEPGNESNCVLSQVGKVETSWSEWQCAGYNMGCPCEFEKPPLLHLRGFCKDSLVEHYRYTLKQSAIDPTNVKMIGQRSARIEYDSSLEQWILSDSRFNVTASTINRQMFFALGRKRWTISGDKNMCRGGQDYTIEMKLTSCNENQFTCDYGGACINMEERCDQMQDCQDGSDEMGCKILSLKDSYNKRVPPVGIIRREVKTLRPVDVNVSLTLDQVVAIKEEDHSIELQFQISLEWKEDRATYYNLKSKYYLNALSEDEIKTLWLPLVIYTNTDQKETTRLGVEWEWSTSVNVKKEGSCTRAKYEEIDEAEIFKGRENSLVMTQSYTHEFQCVYKLERYPFDSQVRRFLTISVNLYFRNVSSK